MRFLIRFVALESKRAQVLVKPSRFSLLTAILTSRRIPLHFCPSIGLFRFFCILRSFPIGNKPIDMNCPKELELFKRGIHFLAAPSIVDVIDRFRLFMYFFQGQCRQLSCIPLKVPLSWLSSGLGVRKSGSLSYLASGHYQYEHSTW